MLTKTQQTIKDHVPDSLLEKLDKLNLTVVDKEDLQITIETYQKLAHENRMLRAQLARRGTK